MGIGRNRFSVHSTEVRENLERIPQYCAIFKYDSVALYDIFSSSVLVSKHVDGTDKYEWAQFACNNDMRQTTSGAL